MYWVFWDLVFYFWSCFSFAKCRSSPSVTKEIYAIKICISQCQNHFMKNLLTKSGWRDSTFLKANKISLGKLKRFGEKAMMPNEICLWKLLLHRRQSLILTISLNQNSLVAANHRQQIRLVNLLPPPPQKAPLSLLPPQLPPHQNSLQNKCSYCAWKQRTIFRWKGNWYVENLSSLTGSSLWWTIYGWC